MSISIVTQRYTTNILVEHLTDDQVRELLEKAQDDYRECREHLTASMKEDDRTWQEMAADNAPLTEQGSVGLTATLLVEEYIAFLQTELESRADWEMRKSDHRIKLVKLQDEHRKALIEVGKDVEN